MILCRTVAPSFAPRWLGRLASAWPWRTGGLLAEQPKSQATAHRVRWLGLAALALLALPSHAMRVLSVSPQGEVPLVQQVRVKFDAELTPAQQRAPFSLSCNGQPQRGEGYWTLERQWILDLNLPVAAGSRCELVAAPALKLEGANRFAFATGGPALARVWPGEGQAIEEDQHFLLQLSGAATPESVQRNAWCEQQGVGDRIGVRLVGGAARETLIQRHQLGAVADRVLLLACERAFAPGQGARLVWGPGIAAAAQPTLINRVADRRSWTVRPRFEAEMRCERERAQAPCLPLRPIVVLLSAAISREQALGARLVPVGGGTALRPLLEPGSTVSELRFVPPLPLHTHFRLELPAGLKDESGRPLSNAASFPLAVATGGLPALAKFAAAPFGILEAGPQAVLPITLRHVQGDVAGAPRPGGLVRVKHLGGTTPDPLLLAWLAKVSKYHEGFLSATEAGWPPSARLETVTEPDEQGRPRTVTRERHIATRELSLLVAERDAQRLNLPSPEQVAAQGRDAPAPSGVAGASGVMGTPSTPGMPGAVGSRPGSSSAPVPGSGASAPVAPDTGTEVWGLPLPEPGYHVVEVESDLLGRALLAKQTPMYVRTGVLVTQLGVHFKRGRESSLVWVTTLDRARPVPKAQVAVNDCQGRTVWQGQTDAQGVAHIPRGFDNNHRDCLLRWAWFVTARKTDAQGRTDLAFTFSDGFQGIEPWRFDQPTADGARLDQRAHTVLDRTLLRAGETVSMKHYFRRDTSRGLALASPDEHPPELHIQPPGGAPEVVVPLHWQGGSAASQWAIPANARPGRYELSLKAGEQTWWTGDFRVEAFRLPLLDARLSPPAGDVVAPQRLALDVQLAWRNGGALAGVPAQVSALVRPRQPEWADWGSYNFLPLPDEPDAPPDDDSAAPYDDGQRLVAERLALTTDAQGGARIALDKLPPVQRPMTLVAELTFNDPNGEVQTVTRSVPLWPAAVLVGLKSRSWVASSGAAGVEAVVINPRGQPQAGRKVVIKARQVEWLVSRKRMVGGFYAYEQHRQVRELGTVCEGVSDEQGRFSCSAAVSAPGQVQLLAEVRDDAGRTAQAGTTVWVTQPGTDPWFPQDNDDRIDVVPEQAEVQPGQTARLQVRMPFRQATALVTVEREGILHTEVVELTGERPVIELKVPGGSGAASWAPNVYVSVLVLRGRVREVPWYSFFQWGWQSPAEWWSAWRHENPQWQPATATIDLAKPSFKLGVAALRVGLAEHALQVEVSADKPQYGVRQTAQVSVRVTQNGQPVPGAHVAFAAVDEALLALRPNTSWELLGAMMGTRPWGVETSTAQGEIIGRRHYGKKAVPAGGGGGANPTRELFNTLLLWRPDLVTDAQGRAQLAVPLNDALTRFRLVAVADAERTAPAGTGSVASDMATLADRFGTGSASIAVSQDLQLLSGLPLAAREGDHLDAGFTVRNATAQAMTLEISPQVAVEGSGTPASLSLPARTLALAAGQSAELSWPVDVPTGARLLRWTLAARDTAGSRAADRLALSLPITPAVPVQVWQSRLLQVPGAPAEALSLPLAAPEGALAQAGVLRGGVQVSWQPSLAGALPGVRRYLEAYPYTCLEQRSSRAVGLDDAAAWAQLVADLPGYLDTDGLAHYYPPAAGSAASGSDRLTAYLVALAHEAGRTLPAPLLERMLNGLEAFVEGRIQRPSLTPQADLEVRKLAALEALSRHGRARVRQLGSVQISPAQWPTAALIDWWSLLRRLPDVPERERLLAQASQLLRARLVSTPGRLQFLNEEADHWWWLMDNPDANANRLILAALDAPDWRADLPALLQGSLGRQQRGAWLTTNANAWGVLAVRRVAQQLERAPVAGRSEAAMGAKPQGLDWRTQPEGGTFTLAWPAGGRGSLSLRHSGNGQPWALVQTLAAVPLSAPVSAGYTLRRTVQPVLQQSPGRWRRGDVLRVRLEVEARADMAWVALADPLPAGATVLGTGLGNDSALLAASGAPSADEAGNAALTHIERSPDAWRGVLAWLPRGRHSFSYTVRLNSSGRFALPPSRVEAMYAPATFAEVPNAALEVAAQ